MQTGIIHEKLAEESLKWQISDSALKQLYESMPNIIATVNAKFRLEAVGAENRNIMQNLDFLMDAHIYFGDMLLAIYQFRLWHDLLDEAIWYAQSIRGRGLYERYFTKMLKTFMISMFSYIKAPDVNELILPLNWLSNHVHELFESKTEETPISNQVFQLLDLLFANDRTKAEELINSFYDEQKSEEAVIDQLITPSLIEIGKLWSENKISVANEHLATANLRSIYHAFFKSHYIGTKWDQEITVCCVPGEEHEIGAELLSLYLENKGWSVRFIGHSTPECEIIRMLEQSPRFAIVLSITIISHLPALDSLVNRLRDKFPAMKIIVGGGRFCEAREVMNKLADAMPESFEQCNTILENMVKSYA
jgi:methanogenic corrinoid protein MtbC1